MKRIVYLLSVSFFLMISEYKTQAQVLCNPIGIHTSPTEPDFPASSGYTLPTPHFENNFNWFEVGGTGFLAWPLTDMAQYPSNVPAMVHPLSNFNIDAFYYSLLISDIPESERDIFMEAGWELIGLNFGKFPDNTPLTQVAPYAPSPISSLPYIILYNKKRAVLRIFFKRINGLILFRCK